MEAPDIRTAADGDEAVRYASWGRRFAALIVDNLLLLVPVGVFGALIFVPNATFAAISAFLVIFFWLIFPFFYFTYCHGKWGQTIGKRWLGIRTRDAELDAHIGYGASFGRYAITLVFGLFLIPALLDYLWPLWDARNQTLHDKVASSIVVRA